MTNVAHLLRGLPLSAAAAAVAAAAPARRPARRGVPGPGRPVVARALHVPAALIGAAAPGQGVTVAVLSTGVDAGHPDLAGSVTAGPDLSQTGRNRARYWGEEGTAVASLIAGHGPVPAAPTESPASPRAPGSSRSR